MTRMDLSARPALSLLVFPFGDGPGRCNYISNGVNRDDVVTLMKEQIKRFEGQPDAQRSTADGRFGFQGSRFCWRRASAWVQFGTCWSKDSAQRRARSAYIEN